MTLHIIIFKTLLLTILTTSLFSQITLTINDLPKENDMQISVVIDSIQSSTIEPGASGDNVLWDYSNLTPTGNLDTILWLKASTTPKFSQFPLSELAIKNCVKYHSHITHKDEIDCTNGEYRYFLKESNGLHFYGLDSQSVYIYDIHRNTLPLISYGDSVKNNSRLIYFSENNTQKVINIQGYSKADAWGIIKTPAGQADVIRIYTNETVYDSIYIDGIGSLQNKTEGNYYYKWYKNGLSYPVFQINKGILERFAENKKIVKYANSLNNISASIYQVENQTEELIVYPNPVSDIATLKFKTEKSLKNFAIEIFDIYGKEIIFLENLNTDEFNFSTNNISKGIYFYRASNESVEYKGKFLKEN